MQDYLPDFRVTYAYSEMCGGNTDTPTAAVHFQIIIGEAPTNNPLTLTVTLYSNDEVYVPETVVTPGPTGEAQAFWLSYDNLPTGTMMWIQARLSDNQGHSTTMSNDVTTVCMPIEIGEIEWNEARTQFTIPVESPIRSDDGEGFAYATYDRYLTAEEMRQWGGSVQTIARASLYRWSDPPYVGTLTNGSNPIDASDGQRVYVSAGFMTWSPEGEYIIPESVAYKSFEVQKPILGLVDPGCEDKRKNIIDIVERKPDGTVTPKGIGGKRVALVEPCDGEVQYGAIHYRDADGYRQVYYCNSVADFNNLADSGYGDTQLNFEGATIGKSTILGVVVGSEITELIDHTFYQMQNLIAVQFAPDSQLTSIGYECLCSCSKYHSRLDFPEGLVTIGERVATQLNNVTAVTIPNTVTTIGGQFLNQSLSAATKEPLVFPASITSVGYQFLSYNHGYNLPITLPPSITEIPQYSLQLGSTFNSQIIFPPNLQVIGESFMDNTPKFSQAINLPNTVTTIGSRFMGNCPEFNAPLNLGTSLQSIGGHFLDGASKFNQDLTIPASVTSIAGGFMYGCKGMKSTLTIAGNTLPPAQPDYNYAQSDTTLTANSYPPQDGTVGPDSDGVHLAGPGAWRWKLLLPDSYSIYGNPTDWHTVRRLVYDGEFPSDMPYMFLNTSGYWQEITTASEVESFVNTGWYSYGPSRNMLQVVFTPRVEEITTITSFPEYFLRLCSKLTTVGGLEHFKYLQHIYYGFLEGSSAACLSFTNGEWVLPETLTSIDSTFMRESYNAASQFKLTLPSSLTYIGDYFLSGSRYNAPLIIPDSVTYLGSNLLRWNNVFNSPLVLPNNSQCIGGYYDSQATYILYGASRFNQPITIPSSWGFVPDYFMGCDPNGYQWFETFDQTITIPEGVARIGNYCFNTMMRMSQQIILPSSCWQIGAGFLWQCWKMTGPVRVDAPWVSIEDPTYTMSTSYCTEDQAVVGITVSGAGAQSIGNQLPNMSQDAGDSYCRKLNIVPPTGTSGPATVTGTYDSESGTFDLTVNFTPTGSVADEQWIVYYGVPDYIMEGSTLTKNDDGSWTAHLVGSNVWQQIDWTPEEESSQMPFAVFQPISSACLLEVAGTVENKLWVTHTESGSTERITDVVQM